MATPKKSEEDILLETVLAQAQEELLTESAQKRAQEAKAEELQKLEAIRSAVDDVKAYFRRKLAGEPTPVDTDELAALRQENEELKEANERVSGLLNGAVDKTELERALTAKSKLENDLTDTIAKIEKERDALRRTLSDRDKRIAELEGELDEMFNPDDLATNSTDDDHDAPSEATSDSDEEIVDAEIVDEDSNSASADEDDSLSPLFDEPAPMPTSVVKGGKPDTSPATADEDKPKKRSLKDRITTAFG